MKALFGLILCLFLVGCESSEQKKQLDSTKQMNEQLIQENDRLKSELDELKNGAVRLLSLAKQKYNEKKYKEAIQSFNALIQKHPEAKESAEAKEFILECEKQIQKQEDEVKAKQQAEKDRMEKAVAKLLKRRDDISKSTKYVPFALDESDKTHAHLYIYQEDGQAPTLRMYFFYAASKWLFIESFSVVADDVKYDFDKVKFNRDHDSTIREWYTKTADSKNIEMITKIINSKKTVIRFYGRQYYDDYTITTQEKESMQTVLDAFKVLNKGA